MDWRKSLAACLVLVVAFANAAAAQVDVSGECGAIFHEDLPHRGGMRLGDCTGLPLNEAGQRKAASWDEAMRSIPEWQCEDPAYLDQPFITSTHFKREADSSKWAPLPC